MKKISKVILVSSIFYSFQVYASDLKDVLKSSISHYPDIRKSLLEFKIAKQKARENLGSFDAKLKGTTNQRVDGYYDGDRSKISLVKPLQALNSEVELGFRRSENTLPVYELQDETLSSGEYFIKANFSLIRDNFIDADRLKLRNAILEKKIKKAELLAKKFETLKKAEIAYSDYQTKNLQKDIFKSLLSLSEKQQTAIERRSRRGDLAKIYETENQQYIAKRKRDLIVANQVLQDSILYLSLFYRDQTGKPIIIEKEAAHLDLDIIEIKNERLNNDFKIAKERNPSFLIYKYALSQLENSIDFQKNQRNPVLDLQLSSARDDGQGTKSLFEEENKIGLNLEIPIERNKVDSRVVGSILKRKKLLVELNFFEDKFYNYLKQLQIKVNALKKAIEINKNEIMFAERLEKAERTKFFNGDSDFILLNLREQKTADAKMKLIKTKLKYIEAYAKYKELTLSDEYRKFIK
jgi:outer membrane protein TolC